MEIFEWKLCGNDWIVEIVGNNWNCVEICGKIFDGKGKII